MGFEKLAPLERNNNTKIVQHALIVEDHHIPFNFSPVIIHDSIISIVICQKLNQLTAKNTKELIEERQRLNLEQEERLRAERNSVGEAFEKAIHCTSQILAEMIQEAIGTMNNWSSSLHDDPSHMNGANNERYTV